MWHIYDDNGILLEFNMMTHTQRACRKMQLLLKMKVNSIYRFEVA